MDNIDKVRDGVELPNCLVFDVPEEKGIEIIIAVTENMRASVFMGDDEVIALINILQNKLNARLN